MDMPEFSTSPTYLYPDAAKQRRDMAQALMHGSGQEQDPKHWSQLFGNIGNRVVGNEMWNRTNNMQRGNATGDASKFVSGATPPPQPGRSAPGPMPFQGGSGMPPMGGMPPQGAPPMKPTPPVPFPGAGGLPPSQGWPGAQEIPHPMGGMPFQASGPIPPQMGEMPSGGSAPPGMPSNEGGIFGGMGKPLDWPQSIFGGTQG